MVKLESQLHSLKLSEHMEFVSRILFNIHTPLFQNRVNFSTVAKTPLFFRNTVFKCLKLLEENNNILS